MKEIRNIIMMIKNKDDKVCKIKNPTLGHVILPYGAYGDIKNPNKPKGGYGFEHIIQKRLNVNELNNDELTGLILVILEKVKSIKPDYWKYDRYTIQDKGIRIAIQKNIFSTDNTWIITAYPESEDKKLKKEALDSISSGIERYKYLPSYSVIRNQIGAIASTIININQKLKKINSK